MGFFDLLTPVLTPIDNVLAFVLPEFIRLVIWALLASAGTMWLYKLFSNQEELGKLKPKIKDVQNAIARYDGPMNGLGPLIGQSFRLSGKQMALTLLPALYASIPVLFLAVFVSGIFGYVLPQAGESFQARPIVEGSPSPNTIVPRVRWDDSANAQWVQDEQSWNMDWPAEGSTTVLRDRDGQEVMSLPIEKPIFVVHKKLWWNWLIANPAGYLAEDAAVDAVELDLTKKQYLGFGPGWMRGWEFMFFFLLIAGSIAIKIIFRIH